MARVSGKITFEGKPVTEGNIAFVSTDPGRPNASSPIGPDGSYDLLTQEKGDGARVGDYRVSIIGRGRGQILDYIPKNNPVEPPKSSDPATFESPDTSEPRDRQVGEE